MQSRMHHKRSGSCSHRQISGRPAPKALSDTAAAPNNLAAAATHRQTSARRCSGGFNPTCTTNNLAAAVTHRQISASCHPKDPARHHCWPRRSGSCSHTQTAIGQKMPWWLPHAPRMIWKLQRHTDRHQLAWEGSTPKILPETTANPDDMAAAATYRQTSARRCSGVFSPTNDLPAAATYRQTPAQQPLNPKPWPHSIRKREQKHKLPGE